MGANKNGSRNTVLAFGTIPKQPPSLVDHETRRCLNLSSETELNRNIVDYIADCVLAMGFKEDNFFSNLRIAITGMACCLGLYSVTVLRYPEDAFLLGISVVTFFALLGVLFFIEGLYLRTGIVNIYGSSGESLYIEGWIERRSNSYTLGIRGKLREVKSSFYLGDLFDTNGCLLISAVYSRLVDLMRRYDAFEKGEKKKIA